MRLKRKNYSFFAPFAKTSANLKMAAAAQKQGMTQLAANCRKQAFKTGMMGAGKLALGAAAAGGVYAGVKGVSDGIGSLKDDIKRDNDPSDTLD